MIIHKDYTTDELIMDEPCYLEGVGEIYPVKVKEYKKFQKYIPYLIHSKKHLKLDNDITLLQGLILISMATINGGKIPTPNSKDGIELMLKVISEFEEMFSFLLRKDIRYFELGEGFIFTDKEGTCLINEFSFEQFRNIVQKMNLLKEPKIFDNPMMQKYYQKYLIAKSKNKADIEFGDIILMVSHDMKMSVNEIKELNVFQLYGYYMRMGHVENYKSSILFKTVSDKVPNIDFSQGISKELYKENDDDMFISIDDISKKL